MPIELIQGSRIERGNSIELGAGLTLQQTAEGIPEIVGGGGAVAFEFTSSDLDGPTFGSYSIGVRIGLWDHDMGGANAGHAIGVDTGAVWYGVGAVTNAHQWYGGETLWAQLHVQGMSNPKLIVGNLTLPPASTLPETSIMGLSVKSRSTDSGAAHQITAHVYAEQTVATVHSIQGFEAYVRSVVPSGTLALELGVIGNVEHDGAGTVTAMYGVAGGCIVRAGTVTKAAGVIAGPIALTGGTVTEGIGLLIPTLGAGTTQWQLKSEGTANSLFSGPVHSRVGTDGSTSDIHLIIGKLSSPASGNAEYRIRTDNAAQAILIIDGNNATTVKRFLGLDYATGCTRIGDTGAIALEVPASGTTDVIKVDAIAGTVAGVIGYFKVGSLRWGIGMDGAAESGSNAGNSFVVYRYSDAASFLGAAITITRSSGAVVLEGSLAWGGGAAITSSAAVGLLADNETVSGNWTFTNTVVIGALQVNGNQVTGGDFNHTGTNWRLGNKGSLGPSPGNYTVTNVTIDRVMDANATTLDEVADVLGTLISDLFARGVIQ